MLRELPLEDGGINFVQTIVGLGFVLQPLGNGATESLADGEGRIQAAFGL